MQKIVLIITAFNRPSYLKQCLDSIDQLTTHPDAIIVHDDKSTDPETIKLIREWSPSFRCPVQVFQSAENRGIRASLRACCDEAFDYTQFDADLVINLDGDAITRPDFIKRLVELKIAHPNHVVSGFNHVSRVNPVVHQYVDYCTKQYFNGINACFDKKQYEKYIYPALQKVGNWDYNASLALREDNLPVLVTTPSCVQHIGMESSMGHTNNGVQPDIAQDYE